MTDTASKADPMLGPMQTLLGNTFRLSAALGEARRDVLKSHVKAMEEQLKTCRAMLVKVSAAKDWQTLQESMVCVASESAAHQGALIGEYARLMTEGMGGWLEQCRACGDQWLAIDQKQPLPANAVINNGLNGISTAFNEFYDQLGRMAFMLNGQGAEAGSAATSARVRQT
ncbi:MULTISPECIES: hypothetical protein [unclassified Cupriavidus]|uniref:hypothetical protein n=1 Tax=unclassified Cupriavidus TaxID=2640874 RepID=UPI0013666937|nr:hypothetical protein [Cupriavidus sp. SW-Y-13]MWL88931.1 hypothetical protein [Cupriavidus sp. SW-Y-13]